MKKYKILLLSLLVFVLTGCSGSYTIKVNDDLSINESVDIRLKNKEGLYEKAVKLFKDNEISEEKYEITQTKEELSIKYDEDYRSFLSYTINSKIYKQLFNKVDYNQNKKIMDISIDSILDLNSKNNSNSNILNDYDISSMQIVLDTPFKVLYNNSDTEYNNTYTWNLDSSTIEKNISFKMSTDYTSNNYIYIIVLSLIGIITFVFLTIFLNRFIKERRV